MTELNHDQMQDTHVKGIHAVVEEMVAKIRQDQQTLAVEFHSLNNCFDHLVDDLRKAGREVAQELTLFYSRFAEAREHMSRTHEVLASLRPVKEQRVKDVTPKFVHPEDCMPSHAPPSVPATLLPFIPLRHRPVSEFEQDLRDLVQELNNGKEEGVS